MNTLHENLVLSLQEAIYFAARCAEEASNDAATQVYVIVHDDLQSLLSALNHIGGSDV